MTDAGTSHWMIRGLMAYCSPITAMANTAGNHTGAPAKITAATPMISSSASRPVIDGSERRSVNPIWQLPRTNSQPMVRAYCKETASTTS